jgi:hypothetical protein
MLNERQIDAMDRRPPVEHRSSIERSADAAYLAGHYGSTLLALVWGQAWGQDQRHVNPGEGHHARLAPLRERPPHDGQGTAQL